MNKIKYISLEDLQKHVAEVVKEVYKYGTEYIVMVDKEPKARISSLIDGRTEKSILLKEKEMEESLKGFVK
ncbi:hypothetical protein JW766_04250 [Candidatus Dojkabacteria bacterium]|nr:hypothetical protein [Candidatus Dojkabacteria bacterium]